MRLRHGSGAIGPSRMRSTWPKVMRSAGIRRPYPPNRPRRLWTMPWRFSSSSICSRNLRGICSLAAISPTISESLVRASASSACSAYLARCEIMEAPAPSDLDECRIDAEAPRHDGDFSRDMVEVGRYLDLDSVAVAVHFEVD